MPLIMKLLSYPKSDNLRASILMILASAGYTFNDACMKAISADIPLAQSVFLRGFITCGLLLGYAKFSGNLSFNLPRREWKLVTFRSLAEAGATFCVLTALFNMPIANVTAILQVLPLTVALASWLFLNETLGWRRLNAIIIGLIGVLLIVKPGTNFDSWSLYALLAVAFITVRDLVVCKMSPTTPSLTVAFSALALITILFGVYSLFVPWKALGIREVLILFSAACFSVIGGICAVAAMRIGEISVVSPFRYTGLIFALVIGLVFFGKFPDAITLIGAAIVVASGVYTIYRENLKQN